METYFHRIGRTGRNGRYGASIVLLTEKDEDFIFNNKEYFVNIEELPQDMGVINDFLKNNEKPAEEEGIIKKKEYTYEPHSLVSEWQTTEHEFYDNTKWKYFEEEEDGGNEVGGDMLEEIEGEEFVDLNEEEKHLHDDDYWAFLKCPVCYQFLVQSEKQLGRKFQILQYFQVGNENNENNRDEMKIE